MIDLDGRTFLHLELLAWEADYDRLSPAERQRIEDQVLRDDPDLFCGWQSTHDPASARGSLFRLLCIDLLRRGSGGSGVICVPIGFSRDELRVALANADDAHQRLLLIREAQ